MWNLFRCVVPALLVVLLLGCSGSAPVDVKPPDDSTLLKGALQDIADSGELGSGADEVPGLLESLKTTDAAKADELLADFSELQGLRDSNAIKSKAQKMLDKL